MNLVALMEDLENDRMIVRLPIGQGTHNHFIGEMFYSKESRDEHGNITNTSASTGQHIRFSNRKLLHSPSVDKDEELEVVPFDDPKTFDRLARAFSGLVYPREKTNEFCKAWL
jgi:hypothetical protein